MTSFYSMKKAATAQSNSNNVKTLEDFLEVNATQKEINTVLVTEYLTKQRKFLWNSNIKDFYDNNHLFIVFGFLVGIVSISFVSIFNIMNMTVNNLMLFPLFSLLGLAIYYYKTYYFNIFRFYGVSVRDKSPENIQKIYETLSILLNSQDLKDTYNSDKRDNFDHYDKRKSFKSLAEIIDKKYFFVSPVVKLSKKLEGELYKKFEDKIRQAKQKKADENCEKKLNNHLSSMNKSTDDIRKDILIKALNEMN